MSTYSIIAIIEGFELENTFQNAYLDEQDYVSVVGETFGVMTIDVSIQSPSPVEAIRQLRHDLKTINVSILRVDPDLVNTSEIARRLDVSRETVRLWSLGRRRAGFPSPYSDVGDSQIWRWAHVWEWAVGQHLPIDGDERPLPADCVDMINGDLAGERHTRSATHREGAVA